MATTTSYESCLRQSSYILPVHKPVGPTSRDVVDEVEKRLDHPKIGHGGTLDPLAEGVLPLLVNEATKILRFLHRLPKSYRVRCRFDLSSKSLDLGETVSEVSSEFIPSRQEFSEALKSFEGTMEQIPPTYSAKKINGQPLYEYARGNEPLPSDINSNTVNCHSIDLTSYDFPSATFSLTCGKGFYVRALVRDLAEYLNLKGGIITSLVRTRYGPFELSDAVLPESPHSTWFERSHPLKSVLSEVPFVHCNESELNRILNGATIPKQVESSEAIAIGPNNKVHAILEPANDNKWKPDRVLNRND